MSDQVLTARVLLIDNDGVLVDSIDSIKQAFVRWGALHGFDGAEIYRVHGGQRSQDIARSLFSVERADEAARELDRIEIEQAEAVRALPGALDFLDGLGGRWTLVTSGPRELAMARLAAAGLPQPALMVSADDISAGKPDPESYLTAARLNQVKAEDCLAFEDSVPGFTAATAAGCPTVHVGLQDRAGQAARVTSLAELGVRITDGGFEILVRGGEYG